MVDGWFRISILNIMQGGVLLGEWLARAGKSRLWLALRLKVGMSTVHYWLHGSAPRRRMRTRIARITDGFVPESAWEREPVARAA